MEVDTGIVCRYTPKSPSREGVRLRHVAASNSGAVIREGVLLTNQPQATATAPCSLRTLVDPPWYQAFGPFLAAVVSHVSADEVSNREEPEKLVTGK